MRQVMGPPGLADTTHPDQGKGTATVDGYVRRGENGYTGGALNTQSAIHGTNATLVAINKEKAW